MSRAGCLSAVVLAAGWAPPAGALQYRSDAYELAAELPESWTVCMDAAPAANHGFRVRLEPDGCEAAGAEVVFAVSYNTAFEYPSTPAMRGAVCGGAAARWSGLRVAGARMRGWVRGGR